MSIPKSADMLSLLNMQPNRYQDLGPSGPCALWTVDLKLSHLDWNPEATLIYFQGQSPTISELEYITLQQEIQNTPKATAKVDVGEFCLVEDVSTAHWYRGQVHMCQDGVWDVFLIDVGSDLRVDAAHISSCSKDFFVLPRKIVCGFLANVLVLDGCYQSSAVVDFLSSLVGKNITGSIQAILPFSVLLLEIPDINNELVRQGFGKHMDKDTFLLLVALLIEVPLKPSEQSGPSCGLKFYKEILPFGQPKMKGGTRAEVRVTAAVHSGLFYGQMASKKSHLRDMSKQLATVFGCGSKYPQHKTQENLSSLCSVKGKNGKWYRGFVQSLPINSQVRVLFVDFGFSESIKGEDIHGLPSDLYSTPIMAFPCSLSSLKAPDEELERQQLSFIKAGLLGSILDVQIDSFDEERCLYLITVVGTLDKYTTEEVPRQLSQPKEESDSTAGDAYPQEDPLFYEKVMGQELVKTLKEEELQAQSVFEAYLEYALTPHNFWLRTTKRNAAFQEMMDKIADHFAATKLNDDILHNPEPGALCCAMYEEDLHFYRAVVTKKLKHGAEVLFIDFGNVEKVPHTLIKRIPEKLAGNSAFAFCCTLVNVMPVDDVWTCYNSDFFRSTLSNKALLVHIIRITGHKCVVDLYQAGSPRGRSISELMVSSKEADYWKTISVQPAEQNQNDVNTNERIHEPTVNGNEDWDQEEVNCKEKSAILPSFKTLDIQPSYEFTVECSCINSPSDFWCQLQDNIPNLEDMMRKLQKYYTLHSVPLQNDESCCVVKSPQDGKWYRASIQERHKDHANVVLVDYGVTIQVKLNLLQRIMPEYVELEGQAFRCSLRNQAELVGTPDEISNYLRSFMASCDNLRCQVVSQSNDGNKLLNVVDLYNTKTQQSATNHLVEQGLAKENLAEEFVYSSFDLAPNQEEGVYVTHVSSEWDIYCQLQRNNETIKDLEGIIAKEVKKRMQASVKPAPLKACLAKYLDGNWYRASVRNTPTPLHFGVFFVDYGNMSISERTQVLSIPKHCQQLLSTPIQALKFNLASVCRKEHYIEVKDWLDDAVLNKQLRAVILDKCQDGSFDVQLFDGDLNINDKVKDLVSTASPKPQPPVSFIYVLKQPKKSKSVGRKNSAKAKFKTPSRDANQGKGTHVCAIPQPKKEHVTVKNQHKQSRSQNKTPARTTNLKTRALKPCKEQVTNVNPQVEKTNNNPQLSLLVDRKEKAGYSCICFVSHIDSMDNFFLHLSDDEAALLDMVEDINSKSEKSLLPAAPVKVNDLVLACYDRDGALYRAVARAYEGWSRIKVNFLDYGNSAVVEEGNIYSLPEEYLSLPAFGIRCHLADSSIYDDDAAFTEAVTGKPLMVHFVQKGETYWEVKVEILEHEQTPDEQMLNPSEGANTPECSSETDDKVKIQDQTVRKVTEDEQGTFETSVKDTNLTMTSCKTFKAKTRSKCKKISKNRFKKKTRNCANTPLGVLTQLLQQNQQLFVPPCQSQNEELPPDLSPHQKLVFAPISLNKEYSGVAASVTTPSEFCVVLNDSVLIMNQVAVLLEFLSESDLPLLPECSLTPGTICLFRSVFFNKWCRAQILNVDSSSGVLDLVDYGLCEHFDCQDRTNLRIMPKDLLKLPKIVYPCVLRGVTPTQDDGHWSDDATVYFQKLLDCRFKVVFRHVLSNTQWAVEVLVDGIQVAGKLVTAGHARYMDAILGLRFQEEFERHPQTEAANQELPEGSSEVVKLGMRQCVLQ
ncbi:tudor domain-containing protein 15 [Festucalex cinctus]